MSQQFAGDSVTQPSDQWSGELKVPTNGMRCALQAFGGVEQIGIDLCVDRNVSGCRPPRGSQLAFSINLRLPIRLRQNLHRAGATLRERPLPGVGELMAK